MSIADRQRKLQEDGTRLFGRRRSPVYGEQSAACVKLLRGLAQLGYTPIAESLTDGIFISRNPAQGRINAINGTDAPTWELGTGTGRRAVMQKDDVVLWAPGGKRYGICFCSHLPLSWLLRFPPERWEIDDVNFLDVLQIRVDPPEHPPDGWPKRRPR